jgi:hypothetical protein
MAEEMSRRLWWPRRGGGEEATCHVNKCNYRRVLNWWLDSLDTSIQRLTTLYSSLLHTHSSIQSRLHCRCFWAASNGGRSHSSGLPKYPRPHLPASNNSSQGLNRSSPLTHYSIFIISGVGLSPLGTAATSGLLYKPQMIDEDDCGAVGGMKIGRGNRSTRRKPAPAPLCPPQNPHDPLTH